MRKKNTLYTANKWNQGLFVPENLFVGGGSTGSTNILSGNTATNMNQAQFFSHQGGGTYGSTGSTGAVGTGTNTGGGSNINAGQVMGMINGKGGSGSGNFWQAIIKGVASVADTPFTVDGYQYKRGIYDATDPFYKAGNTKFSDGSKGHIENKVGNTFSDLGVQTFKEGVNSWDPYTMLAGAAFKSIGDVINNGWGMAYNDKAIKVAEGNTNQARKFGSVIGQAGTNDDLLNASGYMATGTGITDPKAYVKGGVFKKGKAKKEGQKIINNEESALAYQGNAFGDSADNVDYMNDSDVRRKFVLAYGGSLSPIGGALDIMQQNKYLDAIDRRSDAIAGKNQNNYGLGAYTGGARTYADGGLSTAFMDEFGSDPIGAAIRYNRGLEQLEAQREAAAVAAEQEAAYADMQKRLLSLETQNQGLQAMMAAMPQVPLTSADTYVAPEAPVSSSTPSEAVTRPSSGNSNWDYIEGELRKSGKFNDIQIEGIKYNLQRESGIGKYDNGDNGTARGLAQWRGSRIPKDMSLAGQTRHLIETLSNFDGKEHWIGKKNYEGFMNARTPEEAHYWIAKGYERPADSILAKVKKASDNSLRKKSLGGILEEEPKAVYAFGGELGTNGTDWTNGLLYIDEGGSHESNPLDGVPMGVDAEGIPNLVEEGETVYNNYVFSDRMKVPKFAYRELGLGGVALTKQHNKRNMMSFADASKKLAWESEQRPNDPISQAGLEASLSKLAEVQEAERMKQQAERYMGLDEYACGGKMGRKYATGGKKGNLYWGWGDQVNQFEPWIPKASTQTTTGLTPKEMQAMAAEQAVKNQTQAAKAKKTKARSDRSSNHSFGEGANDPETQTIDLSRLENIKPMAITPPEMKPKGIEFSKPLQDALKSEQERNIQNYIANRKEEEYDPYPTWMRYAPAVGSGAMVLGDMLGLTNKPDYRMAERLEAAAQVAGVAPNVEFKPIGDYLSYNPMDIWFEQNRMNAIARAADRTIVNSSMPTGSKLATLLANNYNDINASGNLYRQALEYNDAKRKDVAEFNRKTNMFNSQMGLEADMANARYTQAARQLGLSGLGQAAALRDAIDARTGAAKAANLSNFFTSLGNIGRENFALNQINSDRSRQYGLYSNGTSAHKRSSMNKKGSRWSRG